MAKGDQSEKRILLVDGEEIPGLVNLGEYKIEDDVIEVPGRDKTVPVRNGVKKIPQITGVFKLGRDTKTLKTLQDWYYKKETHDVTLIRTDGAGNEFARELWPNTEIASNGIPAYDAAAPVYAQIDVNFLPEDIIPVAAE